jgi:hypothetical protein
MSNPFGGDARQEDGAVVGTMYDLKQTPEGKPTNMTNAPDANSVYHKFLGKFVESGWNETLLNGFYKVEKPLGAFQIFIPSIPADNAPTAFKVEKYVKPKRWIVVYRGSFTSPESGTYRFVGKCDDILAVRLNNKNVLDGSLTTISKSISRETVGNLWGGDWFQLSAGQIYPIQIMIGEEPGGEFYAYLLIQKKGENYPSRPNNAGPILPVFQLAPTNMPKGGPTVAPQAFICQ